MAATRVCGLDELSPASAKKVVVDGRPVAVVMDSAGAVHALGDTCTHGEISLSEGFVEDDAIECWAHGSKFELTTGKPRNFPAYEPVPVYAVTVENGDVLVDVDTIQTP
ncbi:non-heme iron oxygenase ferredoxin subunit [Microcella sp.]|uniref:non-heme iron oxygenase ferredoxin subunit n=1 Tax=Microcella sp. TaxID=1913979 RepID=UPI00255F4239|nr:non-heme iron oxygenase ferredoxin subunit [Microcella sp.]MBX9470799.1 non-heme iron oxygenase ferredoxin subunit [Microcella sp.]